MKNKLQSIACHNIMRLLNQKKCSLHLLSLELEVDASQLSRILSGKAKLSLALLNQIATYMQIPPYELLQEHMHSLTISRPQTITLTLTIPNYATEKHIKDFISNLLNYIK